MNFDPDDLLELGKYLDQNSISRDKVCIVGSAVLSLMGIRQNDDIDIVIHSSLNMILSSHSFINLVKSPWSKLHSDDELIDNNRCHFIYAGYKFVIPELLYHRKAWHNRSKDILDINDLDEYANMHDDWDWALIKQDLPIKSGFNLFLIKLKNKLYHLISSLKGYFSSSYYIHRDCHQMISLDILMSRQIIDGDFNRFDIIVRYLAIHAFINNKGSGVELYQRMQNKRGASVFSRPWKKFQKLISSFDRYGYDNRFPILVNDDLHIVDGAHRLACALYFNIPFIPVKVNSNMDYSVYSMGWFKENSFTSYETSLLNDQKDVIFKEKKMYFEVILWPPVMRYFDEIERDIQVDFSILESTDYSGVKNFDDYVRDVYKIDDIKDWKVDLKIKGFSNYKKDIRILKIIINEPRFRKKANGNLISERVEELKSKIRRKYMQKVQSYFHDIIIHVGDSYQHTQQTSALRIHT